ncbi:hypothetical protein RU95_GL001307 [Enterococcus avium]|jgi:hypothetical protein|nr:hypothetical protein RU95_GL001307 [Enterococcus avium]
MPVPLFAVFIVKNKKMYKNVGFGAQETSGMVYDMKIELIFL